MQVVVQVKLLPDVTTARALTASLRVSNVAANWVSEIAYRTGLRGRELRTAVYHEVKARFGLSAQPAQHTIKKVSDAYKTVKALCDRGVLKGRRKAKAESKPVAFRLDAAQPYDLRCLSWRHDSGQVSIWTIHGRMIVPFIGEPGQIKQLADADRIAESDLVYRDGMWFLDAVIDVEEQPEYTPRDWIGVDRGIVNIATSSDGRNFCGKQLRAYRTRCAWLRAKLQAKATKSAKRLLKKRRRREQRHQTNINHVISKLWSPMRNAPHAASPWKTSRASATGYGCIRTSGPPSDHGPSTSFAATSPTKPSGPGCRSLTSTPGTPPSNARDVNTRQSPTVPPGTTSDADGAGSLAPPI